MNIIHGRLIIQATYEIDEEIDIFHSYSILLKYIDLIIQIGLWK